jgi:hypothetical protein
LVQETHSSVHYAQKSHRAQISNVPRKLLLLLVHLPQLFAAQCHHCLNVQR